LLLAKGVRVVNNTGFVKVGKDVFFQGSRTIHVNESTTNYVSLQLIKKACPVPLAAAAAVISPLPVAVNRLSIYNENDGYYILQSPIDLNITEFGSAGSFIAGYLSTNMRDSSTGNSNIPVSLQFRIKRPN
jgi:hypothetical protein